MFNLNLKFWRRGRCPVSSGRTIDVGWLIDTDQASFIWPEPQKLQRQEAASQHAKSVRYCPAMLDHEARLFEITCPIDLHLRLQYDDKTGQPQLINAAGEQSSIRSKHLGAMVALVDRKEWRHPERPILQITTPYIFLADESVYLTQLPPFARYSTPHWPGVLIGGRFPIDVWPRTLVWAFEWCDTSTELAINRGQPWFYVRFETQDPTRAVRLVEAEMTPALREYANGIRSVTNYVSRTFSLFSTALQRRPRRLLVVKKR